MTSTVAGGVRRHDLPLPGRLRAARRARRDRASSARIAAHAPPGGRLAVSAFSAAFAVRHLEEGEEFDPATGVLHERGDGPRTRTATRRRSTSGPPASPPASSQLLAERRGPRGRRGPRRARRARTARRPPTLDHPELLLLARRPADRRASTARRDFRGIAARPVPCPFGLTRGPALAPAGQPAARAVPPQRSQVAGSGRDGGDDRHRPRARAARPPRPPTRTADAETAAEAADRGAEPTPPTPKRSTTDEGQNELVVFDDLGGQSFADAVDATIVEFDDGDIVTGTRRQDRQRRGAARHRLQVRGRHPVARALDPQRRRPARDRLARRRARGPRPPEGGQGRPPHPVQEARAVRARLGHDRGDQGEGRRSSRARSSRWSRAA